MIDYDYLDWGVGLPKEEDFKKVDYREQARRTFFTTDRDAVVYEENSEEDNPYDVRYLHLSEDRPWKDDPEDIQTRRRELEREVARFAASIVPGHPLWQRGESTFLDAFLLYNIENVEDSRYDNVLLLAPEGICPAPLAVVWEMVPESRRNVLMNLQAAGAKVYGLLSETFCKRDEGILCIEIYCKKD